MGDNLGDGVFLFCQSFRWDWNAAFAIGGLLGVLFLGAWAIWQVKRWREVEALPLPTTNAEQLEHYRNMVDQGLLDPAEFEQIRERLSNQNQGETSPPAQPPASEPPDTSFRE